MEQHCHSNRAPHCSHPGGVNSTVHVAAWAASSCTCLSCSTCACLLHSSHAAFSSCSICNLTILWQSSSSNLLSSVGLQAASWCSFSWYSASRHSCSNFSWCFFSSLAQYLSSITTFFLVGIGYSAFFDLSMGWGEGIHKSREALASLLRVYFFLSILSDSHQWCRARVFLMSGLDSDLLGHSFTPGWQMPGVLGGSFDSNCSSHPGCQLADALGMDIWFRSLLHCLTSQTLISASVS